MEYPPEIQELLDKKKLREGFCIGKEHYVQPIDYLYLEPTENTYVATSEGHGILVSNPCGDAGWHTVDFFYNHPPFSRKDENPNIASRVSVLLYEKQKDLMDRLINEYWIELRKHEENFKDVRNFEPRKYLSRNEYSRLGLISFLTLEAIMRARNEGIYADREIFGRNTRYEPLADPKNEKVILEYLPYLWDEDGLVLMADKTSEWRRERNTGSRERFRKMVKAIGAKPDELVDALGTFGSGPCIWNHKVLGGCFPCTRDCD